MGLDILTAQLQQLRKNQEAANNVGWLLNIANLLCLDDFLRLMSLHITVLTQFKNMLNSLIVTAGASVAIFNVYIAQLETANAILVTFINIFKTAQAEARSKLGLFPFSDPNYIQCPPVQAIKDFVTNLLPQPDPSSLLPGNAGKFAKKYKQSLSDVNEMQYRLYRNGKQIQKMKQKIAQVQAQILAWQAIVNAIGAQFGA